MSTRPAEITTPYGWTELFDAIRATRTAIRWIDDRIEHLQDLRDNRQPIDADDTNDAARPRRPDLTVDDVITALWTFIDNRAEQRRAASSPDAAPGSDARTGTQPPSSTEPGKGSEAMQPNDEQRRRDALIAEEHERQQHDLQSDGVLDGDYDREPGDGGTADLDLEG